MYFRFSNTRSLRGPGGVGGLDLRHWARSCARELASVASRGGLPRFNTTISNSAFGRDSCNISIFCFC